ncbi:AI-2E family transporter [Microbacterium elymi]|uniref:AI-2E family transporter n=1 Tax=Microbacterium elymi TaxID=2909587 RepID=A0ABY5NLA3_9MICO|nr:AI-2E family transporter [Microbacterium elymi]UUT35904.1 AI-2E family transporter [Microbacterium elymi]
MAPDQPAHGVGASASPDAAAAEAAPAPDAGSRGRRGAIRRFLPARPLTSGFLVAIGVLLAVGLALTLGSLSSVFVSVFLGAFLALGLDPAVRALQRLGLSRGGGVTAVAITFLVVVALIVVWVIPATVRQFVHAVEAAPAALAQIEASDWFTSLQSTLGVDLPAVVGHALASAVNLSSFLAVSGGVLRVGFGVIGAISSGVIVVVLTLYFVVSLADDEVRDRHTGAAVPAGAVHGPDGADHRGGRRLRRGWTDTVQHQRRHRVRPAAC